MTIGYLIIDYIKIDKIILFMRYNSPYFHVKRELSMEIINYHR